MQFCTELEINKILNSNFETKESFYRCNLASKFVRQYVHFLLCFTFEHTGHIQKNMLKIKGWVQLSEEVDLEEISERHCDQHHIGIEGP